MPIDLATIIGHIREMSAGTDPAEAARRRAALEQAWSNLDTREVNRRYETARTSFLLAESATNYRQRAPLPEMLVDYSVAAADGSFITPDRHSPLTFYVLNTSKVVLSYGATPGAEIGATPGVYYREEDLTVPDDPQRTPIQGTVLGFRRAIEELKSALDGAANASTGPTLALQDGTLVLWQLQGQTEPVRQWVLRQYLDVLEELREREIPVASYISSPGAAELVNMLRVAVCDFPDRGLTINCDECRTMPNHTPKCDILPAVPDRHLMREVARLQPGERTTVYRSRSRILDAYEAYGSPGQRICFFYLNVGHEIARIEIPLWVAEDIDLLERVHAIVYDQAILGRGYPVALQEAHEAAVLSMADRRMVEQAVERALAETGIVSLYTGKDGSKRGRFI